MPFRTALQFALHVLIWLCLLLIIGLTQVLWRHLREEGDRAARLWIAGLGAITLGGMVQGLLPRANGLSGSTMVLGTWMFVEAMRAEAGRPPVPGRWVVPAQAVMLSVYAAIEWRGLYGSVGVALTPLALAVLEAALLREVYAVGRSSRSRGMVLVGAGIAPVFVVNLAWVASLRAEGLAPPVSSHAVGTDAILLSYTAFPILTTIGFIAHRFEKSRRQPGRALEEKALCQVAPRRIDHDEFRPAREVAESLGRTREGAGERRRDG